MIYEKILCDKRMTLPFKYQEDYVSSLMTALTNYEILLGECLKSDSNYVLESVHDFHKNIHDIIEFEYSGHHKDAMDIFKETLDQCLVIHDYKRRLTEEEFFRIRKGENKISEMFHIPFGRRVCVGTQRYSYPGLPCLYLGASVEVCMNELGLESRDEKTIALIKKRNDQNINILDIAYTPGVVLQEYNRSKDKKKVENYLSIWPLLLACSVCVKERE